MVEFVLVAPVLLLFVVGTLESALVLASIGAAGFAAGDVARVLSETPALGASGDVPALTFMSHRSFLTTTSIASIDYVDIYATSYNATTKTFLPLDASGAKLGARYRLTAGGSWVSSLPPGVTQPFDPRGSSAQDDQYIGVTISYRYYWKLGFLAGLSTQSAPYQAFPTPGQSGTCDHCIWLSTTSVIKAEPTNF